MADRLRIVQERWPLRPLVVYDLATSSVFPSRSSLKITPGKPNAITVDQGGRYGGSIVTDERLSNASVAVTLVVLGSSADNALDLASEVIRRVSEPPRGRWLEWRPDGAGQSVYFELRGSASWDSGYDWAPFVGGGALTLTLTWSVAPVAFGDHADAVDLFETDTIAAGEWTVDAGGGTLSVVSGEVVPSTTAIKRLRHVANGYTWRNGMAMIRWRSGSSVASYDVAVGVACSTTDNGIYARLNAGNISISKRVGGSWTDLVSFAFAPSANTDHWIVVRREGPRVSATIYTPYRPTFDVDTQDTAGAEAALTAAEMALMAPGRFGIVWTPGVTSERVSDFYGLPYSFDRYTEVQDLDVEAAPGDVPPLLDVSYMTDFDTPYGLLAWWPQPRIGSHVPFGAGTSFGWTPAALTGINAAGTSVNSPPSTNPKFNRTMLEVVTTATNTSGAHQLIPDAVRERRLYCVAGFVSGASGSARLRAGPTANPITTATITLSAAWQFAAAVGTFPNDSGDVYAGVLNGSAAITTIDVDGFVFFSPPAISDMTTTALSTATSLPIREVPAEWPEAPFYAVLVNGSGPSEIVRVKAGSTAGALLVDRGQLGTVALAVTANMLVCPLPESLWQRQGNGASVPRGYGFLESDSIYAGTGFTRATSGATHGGAYMSHTIAAGAEDLSLSWLYDPSLVADDDPGGVTLVECYVRSYVDNLLSQTARAIISATSAQTGTRYTLEYGADGAPFLATPGANVTKTFFVGTLAFAAEKGDPSPLTITLEISYGAGSSAGGLINLDYVLLVPARARVASPEGRAVDASYPYFYQSGLGGGAGGGVKTIRSDRSGVVTPNGSDWRPYSDGMQDVGLGGARLEPAWQKRGGVFLFRGGSRVPNDPSPPSDDTDTAPGRLHLCVQPRYALFRGGTE